MSVMHFMRASWRSMIAYITGAAEMQEIQQIRIAQQHGRAQRG